MLSPFKVFTFSFEARCM